MNRGIERVCLHAFGLLVGARQRFWLEAMAAELEALGDSRERLSFLSGCLVAVLRLATRRVLSNLPAWAIALLLGVLIPVLDTHRGRPCLMLVMLVGGCGTLAFVASDAPWRWAVASFLALAAAPLHSVPGPFLDRGELPAVLLVAVVVAYAGAMLRWVSARVPRWAPLLLLTLLPVDGFAQEQTGPTTNKLDSLVRAELRRTAAPGAAVLVERAGQRLLDRGYGVADVKSAERVAPATVFPIGSITKQFTAVAVLKQVAAGRIALTDAVADAFPAARLDRRITVQQLLTHTSGLTRYEQQIPNVVAFSRQNIRPDTVLHYIAGKALVFEPGTRWAYSNTNYHLLGLLLEQRTKRSFFDHLQQDVIGPVGLRSTRACAAEGTGSAHGYELEANGPELVLPINPALPFAAGALCSTTRDLAIWLRALTNGQVVPAESYRRMSSPTQLADGTREAYGFGLMVGEMADHRWIAHGGSLPGFDAYVARYPGDDLTIVVLANGRPFDGEGLQKRLARVALGLPEPRVLDLPLTAAQRAAYVGSYDAGVGEIRIVEEGERLELQGPGSFPLLFQGSHLFVAREDPDLKVEFVLEAGRITGLVLTARGRQYQARRTQ
jgi:D-alanyl-D-alanine carboxypeptidase